MKQKLSILPQQVADDMTLELSPSLRESLKTMTVGTFQRIPRSIKESMGLIQKRSKFVLKSRMSGIWKSTREWIKIDKKVPLSKYIQQDTALVPMKCIEGKYYLQMVNSERGIDSGRRWVHIHMTGRLLDNEEQAQGDVVFQPQN